MAFSASQLLSGWNKNRLHRTENRCPCKNCCLSSNICAHCKNWSDSINWKTVNAPNIKCAKCTNSYHLDCLPLVFRVPGSWGLCNELDNKFMECSIYRDFFTFLNVIENQEEIKKYESLIHDKYQEIYPHKKLIISNHFCGFQYNQFTYIVEDCVQILLNGEPPANARIIDIFSTQNHDAFLLIQWYWIKNDFLDKVIDDNNSTELYFDNKLKNADIIRIGDINSRIKVVDSLNEYKWHYEKLRKLQHQKKEKQIDGGDENGDNGVNVCLKDNLITFDKVFWSNNSCNGDIKEKQIYKTNINDTNKSRMELQNKILSENKKIKKENKRKINKKQRMHSENNNNNNNNNNINDKSMELIQFKNNRKRKKRDFDDNNNKMIIPKMNPNKKRKIDYNQNKINNNNDDDKVTLNKTEYSEYLRLKNKSDTVSRTEYDKLIKELNEYKKYKEEIQIWQKSKIIDNTKIQQFEMNEQEFKKEISAAKSKYDTLYKEGKRKRALLRDEHKKSKKKYEDKINSLNEEIKELEKTIANKDEQITFFKKARDFRRNQQQQYKQNSNHNNNNNNNNIVNNISNTPYHISPADPRLVNQQNTTNPVQLLQQEMHSKQIRDMF